MSESVSDYVSFGEVARTRLKEQCQYAVRYLKDPELSSNIRWLGDPANYHFVTIHEDDVDLFVERVQRRRDTVPE